MDDFRLRYLNLDEGLEPYLNSVSLIEQKPHSQKMWVIGMEDIWVEMPWLYYLFAQYTHKAYNGATYMLGLFCSPRRITSANSQLYIVPLSNLGNGINPCYAPRNIESPQTPFADIISDKIASWWGARFNGDYIKNQETKSELWRQLQSPGNTSNTERPVLVRRVMTKLEALSAQEVKKLNYTSLGPVDQVVSNTLQHTFGTSIPTIDKLCDRKIPTFLNES